MTTPAEPAGTTPIADRSRLTRRITRALLKNAIRDDLIAHQLAVKIVDDLIQEYGGGQLYVPIADRRPGGAGSDTIETHLRHALTLDAMMAGSQSTTRVVNETAVKFGVSTRTVFRVLERVRGTA